MLAARLQLGVVGGEEETGIISVINVGELVLLIWLQKMRTPGNRPLRALMAIDAGGPQRESGRRAEENGEPLELEQVRQVVLLRREQKRRRRCCLAPVFFFWYP